MTRSSIRILLLGTALSAIATAAFAQDAVSTGGDSQLNEIVVTAAPGNPLSRLRSSASVSTLKADAISQSAPSSAADIIRDLPGFRSESSGGEGNANVTVRGVPLASGGSKYVQWQEDGLPVLQDGDIDFATPDTFLRADFTTDRVEAVRGGTSSTTVSDAPGAVLNFISKDGKTVGGAVGVTTGLNYDEVRYDFDYGGPISETTRFNVGGFYNSGEGTRKVGFQAVGGGQIKANITHDIDGGFLRLNLKFLDDRSPALLDVPVMISGSVKNPNITPFPGFNVSTGVVSTPALQNDVAINANGDRVRTDVSDGYHSKQTLIGAEFNKKLGDGWKIDDKFSVSHIGGDFVGSQAVTPGNVAAATAITGGSAVYATGPNAGQTYTGNAVAFPLYNVTLNDLGNYFNDLKINKDFGFLGGSASVQFGLFNSRQNIAEDWHWNVYLETISGYNAQLLNAISAAGVNQSDNGVLSYGGAYGGQCCTRVYNLHYDTTAPNISASWQGDKLNVDGGLRYDIASASGTYGGGSSGPGGTGTALETINVQNTPTLSVPDQTVAVVNSTYTLRYTKRYLSYSFGANYEFNPDLAIFARTSLGGRFNNERLLFGGGITPATGTTNQVTAVNEVQQTEGGVKYKTGGLTFYGTLFYAITHETTAGISPSQPFLQDTYRGDGVELESSYRWGDFSVRGGVTYTDAAITKAFVAPGATSTVGNPPARQAPWVYQFTPSYDHGPFEFSLNVIGTGSSYASTNKTLVMPGYAEVNLLAAYKVTPRLTATVSGNNIFNAVGMTEVGGGSGTVGSSTIPGPGYNTARFIDGPTFKGSLKYTF